jgi:thymidylate kinase
VAGILLEGVTGAGKTQTMLALMRHPKFSSLLGAERIFDEEKTFGEVMTEIQELGNSSNRHMRRLEQVLSQIERDGRSVREGSVFLLERFHLSYYALLPDWTLYANFDERLATLRCLTVLLQIPEQDLSSRCLDRKDRADTSWSVDMVAHYGSRQAVMDAIIQSTVRRREATQRSQLPILEIDTTSRSWEAYADKIVEAWSEVSKRAAATLDRQTNET